MSQWLSRLLLAAWFVGMVGVAVRGMPAQGQGDDDPSKQYFPTMVRNAPVLAEPPLHGYLGLAVVGINEATDLFTLRADGSEVRRLTNNSVAELSPQWSPGGNQIAFFQRVPDAPEQLQTMVMNRDGSGLQAIGSPKVGGDGELKWSPNGRYLLTVIGNVAGDLTLLAVDGSEDRVIAAGMGYDRAWQIGWSRDGQYVHYVYEGNLWIYTLNTGATVNLGTVLTYFPDRAPARSQILWHPLRDEIVFITSDEEGVIVSPDGTQRHTLFQGRYRLGGWLEAGNRLLLTHRLTYTAGDALYTLPLNRDILPFVVNDGYYGVELEGILPAGNAVMYHQLYTTSKVEVRSLVGDLRQIDGAYCHGSYSSLCGVVSPPSWSGNGEAVVFEMSTWDTESRRSFSTTISARRTADGYTAIRIPDIGSPSLFPFATTQGIGYEISGYPPPIIYEPYQVDTTTGSVTRLVPELGRVVRVVEWRYLP